MSEVFLVIVVFFTHESMSHTYSSGSCHYVEPIPDFDMTKVFKWYTIEVLCFHSLISYFKFLGRWYAIQKTATESSCVNYNFKEGEKSGEYLLEQTSERYPTKLNVSYVFDYTGKIKADKHSSTMTIHFPLSGFKFCNDF